MLEEARRELSEARERAQLSPAHTFSPFPNFFKRPAELRVIESALQGDPSFTVLFGASSVGKVSTVSTLGYCKLMIVFRLHCSDRY